MKTRFFRFALLAVFLLHVTDTHAQDPLASWNDGAAKQAIVDMVESTTSQASPQFVPPRRTDRYLRPGRHAVGRAPDVSQVMYCLQRVPALVKEKPELAEVAQFSTVLKLLTVIAPR